MMRKYDLARDRYWVTQSGYFILSTKVALGMSIANGKLLVSHDVSEGNLDKEI